MSFEKTKSNGQTEKSSNWLKVRNKNVALFQTLTGPIIGFEGESKARSVRVWAPAKIMSPTPGTLIYMPILLCEEYLDLHWATMFGTQPVPDVVAQGYLGYFEEFIKGSYNMRPCMLQIQPKDGEAHEITDPRVTPDVESQAEPCPACKQEVSNWQAHYPVLVAQDPDENGLTHRWRCELTIPDIREKFPDYVPVRPEPAPTPAA